MKKIFFSLVAIAALAACSKSEIAYEQTGEIAFSPVAKPVTKSVAGYDYGTSDTYHTDGNDGKFDGVFPTGVNLYIFANAQDEDADGVLQDSWTSAYFQNALFVHTSAKGTENTQNSVPTAGAYAGDPTRYWPNVKTLKFVGYSAACNVTSLTPTVANDLSTLTIAGYVQDNAKTAEGANDLMWFPVTEAYGKAEGEIPAQMKHACSWITINVAVADNIKDNGYKLNKLEALQLIHEGEVECSATAANWTFDDEPTKANETYFENAAGVALSTAATKHENTPNNFIVLPQTPVDLNVTYTYTSDAVHSLTLTETKPVSLKFNGETAWAAGVHYIYNITITATEILIDPVVVDWTNFNGNNIDKELI